MKTAFLSASFLAFAMIFDAQAKPTLVGSDPKTGTSLAVLTDGSPLAYTTQFLPVDENDRVIHVGNAAKQIEQTLKNLTRALREAKSGPDKVVKINVCVSDEKLVGEIKKQFAKTFKKSQPAVSFVVGALSQPDALVALDAVAQTESSRERATVVARMENQGAFAHVKVSPGIGTVYISGQAQPGELAEATSRTLDQLQGTLKFLRLEKSDVLQVKCFIQPAGNSEIAKAEIAKFFSGQTVPPLVFVDWSSPKLPIEIELVAASPTDRTATNCITYLTPPEFKPSNVYSKVARVNFGKLIFISGLYGTTPQNPEKQVLEIFAALQQLTAQTGSDFDSLAKATYYVSDGAAGNQLNSLRPKFFNPNRPPAASKASVRSVGQPGMSVTFDMIAVAEK